MITCCGASRMTGGRGNFQSAAELCDPGICGGRIMGAVKQLGYCRPDVSPPMTFEHRANPPPNRRHEIAKGLEIAPLQMRSAAIAQQLVKSVRLELQRGREMLDAAQGLARPDQPLQCRPQLRPRKVKHGTIDGYGRDACHDTAILPPAGRCPRAPPRAPTRPLHAPARWSRRSFPGLSRHPRRRLPAGT